MDNRYFVFDNYLTCAKNIQLLERKLELNRNRRIALPLKNQISQEWMLIIPNRYYEMCSQLFNNCQEIKKKDAINRGWYLGYAFKGTFAREREKLEDMHLLFDMILQIYGSANFPAIRSLIHSFLGSCYAIRVNCDGKIKKIVKNDNLKEWWNNLNKKSGVFKKNGELIKEWIQYMNTQKHGGQLANQVSVIELIPNAKIPLKDWPKVDQIGSEGFTKIIDKGSIFERRKFLKGDGEFFITAKNPPKTHFGKDLDSENIIDHLKLIRNAFCYFLYKCEYLVGERFEEPTETDIFKLT